MLPRGSLEFMLSQPPPRRIEPAVQKAVIGFFLPMPLRIALFTMPFVVLAVTVTLMVLLAKTGRLEDEWRLLREETAVAAGTVLKAVKNRGSKGKITYVYDFEFVPSGIDGKVSGFCFSDKPVAAPGDRVEIEYLPGEPQVSRISGCRLTPVPLEIVLVLLLSGVGGFGIPAGVYYYRKHWVRNVLRDGLRVEAVVENVRQARNGRMVTISYDMQGEDLTAGMQLPLQGNKAEVLQQWQESGIRLTALAVPGKKNRICILDFFMYQGYA